MKRTAMALTVLLLAGAATFLVTGSWTKGGVEAQDVELTSSPPGPLQLDGSGFDMEVDAARGQLYVSIPSLDEVAVISMNTLQIIDHITFGGQRPQGLDLGLDGSTLYVALNQAGSVAVVDLESKTAMQILVGAEVGNSLIYDVVEGKPHRLYVSANPGSGGFAYLALVKLDQSNETSRITSGGIVRARPVLLPTSDGTVLYVGEGFSPESLYKFDITTDNPLNVLEDQHGSISGTDRLDLSPDGDRIYLRSGQVLRTESFIQAAKVAAGVPRVSKDGSLLYVGAPGSILVYDRASLIKVNEFAVSFIPDRIEVAPDESGLFVLGGSKVAFVSFSATPTPTLTATSTPTSTPTPVMDSDGDGWLNDFDNCLWTSNAGQEDADEDHIGDVCDPVGGGAFLPKTDQLTVLLPTVGPGTHISVTFVSDPGRATVSWIELLPGVGFCVHLTGKVHGGTRFTYMADQLCVGYPGDPHC